MSDTTAQKVVALQDLADDLHAEIRALRQRVKRAERILAALREPSEVLVEATAQAEVPRTWPTLSEADRAALRFIARTTIVAAVAAAEREVDG